eukprot:898982-Prymnesium_polylepis.2
MSRTSVWTPLTRADATQNSHTPRGASLTDARAKGPLRHNSQHQHEHRAARGAGAGARGPVMRWSRVRRTPKLTNIDRPYGSTQSCRRRRPA